MGRDPKRKVIVSSWLLRQEYKFSGGAVRYDTLGEGPPLVLVHGTPFSPYVWRNIAPELAKNRTVHSVHSLQNRLIHVGSRTRVNPDERIG